MMSTHEHFVSLCRKISEKPSLGKGLFEQSHTPDLDQMVGWGYRGFNTFFGARIGGMQEFMKVFFRSDVACQELYFGYNMVVKQNGLGFPLELLVEDNAYTVQGAFNIRPSGSDADARGLHQRSVLFDYGGYAPGMQGPYPLSENKIGEGRLLRDFVVQPFNSPDILLGRPYLKLGGLYVPLGYFVLERDREVDNGWSCGRIAEHFARRSK